MTKISQYQFYILVLLSFTPDDPKRSIELLFNKINKLESSYQSIVKFCYLRQLKIENNIENTESRNSIENEASFYYTYTYTSIYKNVEIM